MSEALSVKAWGERARGLGREEFARRYPHPFLVQEIAEAEEDAEAEYLQFSTVEVGSAPTKAASLLTTDALGSLHVLPVVKRRSGAFEGMVFVGRAENNDIVQDHSSISKCHAFFTKDPSGDFYSLTDAGSTNGTFVSETRLAPHDARRLSAGEVVSFGRTRAFRFHHPETFHQLLALASR
jgi:hypothetical protein